MLTLTQLKQLRLFSQVNSLDITPLIDGLSHQLYKVSYRDNRDVMQHHVLRFIKATPQQTAQEYLIMKQAYALDIAPEPIAMIDVSLIAGQTCTLIVMDFIKADLAVNVELTNNHIKQLAHCLNTLHNLDFSSCNLTTSVNNLCLLDQYWQSFPCKTPANIKRFEAITTAVESLTFDHSTLIHGDLNLSNILMTPSKMTWIDWEYAAIGDAYFDYATLCVESIVDIEEALISALQMNGLSSVIIDRKRLQRFKLYYAATCWLWSPSQSNDAYIKHRERYQDIVDRLLTDS